MRIPKLAFISSLAGALLMMGCASFSQKSGTAFSREPGERFLGNENDVGIEARKHWQFAWLAAQAYKAQYNEAKGSAPEAPLPDEEVIASDPSIDNPGARCRDPAVALRTAGWHMWQDFPSDADGAGLVERLHKVNLRIEVWEHIGQRTVVVAFGGTVFTSTSDWLSNLRWFIPGRYDAYTSVQKDFVKAFQAKYKERAATIDHEFMRTPKLAHLVSTGHSLGGGLAQQFAYALPIDNDVPPVEHVYAFDPSPVTGYFSVDKALREANARTLKIDRIYERGEILAFVRSITNAFWPPSIANPEIRTVRYALFYKNSMFWNSVASHSIPSLACELDIAKDRP